MFEFRFGVDKATDGVYGKQLKEVLGKFHSKAKETCWLHIRDVPHDQNTNYLESPSYHNYCIAHLCQQTDDGRIIILVRNYNEQGVQQSAVTLVTILKQIATLVFNSDDRLFNLFDKYVLPHLNARFLGRYANDFNKYAVRKSFLEPAKNNSHSSLESAADIHMQLQQELLKLIELYCQNVGSLVIDVGNIDSISPSDKLFFANLMRKISRKLCLITTTCEKAELSFPDVSIFDVDVSSIVKDIMKRLIRASFNLTRADERELRKFILNERHASNIAQATEIIKNIFEVCNASSSGRQHGDKISNVDLALVKQHYLLPSDLEKLEDVNPIKKTSELTIEEMKIRYLCSILGPYIKLSDLEQIYRYFFEEDYPSNVDYSKLALMNNDGLIRYTSLSVYDKARQEQKTYKQPIQATLKKKIRHGVIECVALKQHIEALHARRNQLPSVMGLRLHEAITSLYGLDIHQSNSNMERGLSGSSERRPDIVRKSSDLNSKTEEIIIVDCFDELIDYYYQKDMLKAFDYFRIFTNFIDDFDRGRFEIDDLELAGMISLKKSRRKKANPFANLHPSTQVKITRILVKMLVVAYFLKKYWPIRRYIYQVYLLQTEDSSYEALIEAGVGLVVTQAAENQFKVYIDNELDNPISNPTLPNQDFESYSQLQASASALALSADAKLGPSSSEYAITACMIYAVGSGKSIRYNTGAERLLAAYKKAFDQKDYPKTPLALGNALLLYFCAGNLPISDFKEKCIECIALCDKYNPYPKPIIQGLLNFSNYIDGTVSSTEGFNLEIQTAEPNHFFINFTTLLILFYKGDYAACVNLCEKMRQLELQGGEDNTRVGYCIWRSFEIIEAVALLRHLENNPEQETEARIRQIRYTEKAFKICAKEFPENFDYRYKFLIAEISRSRLSKQIIGRDTLSLDKQSDCYQEALDFALDRGNLYYSKEISKLLKQIRENKTASAQSSAMPQQPVSTSGIAVVTSNADAAKKTYDEQVTELVQRTGSNAVVLFIYDESKKSVLPKLIFCHNEKVNEVSPAFTGEVFSIENPPESVAWDHPAIQRSVKNRKLIFYRAEECVRSPLLQAEGIKSMMAIPIIKPDPTTKVDRIVAILYFQSKIPRDYNNSQLDVYAEFARTFFNTVDANPEVLAFARFNNRRGMTSASRTATSRSANTSKSSNASNTPTSSRTPSPSTPKGSSAFFHSNQKPKTDGSATSSDEKSASTGTSTDEDLDLDIATSKKSNGRPRLKRAKGQGPLFGKINIPDSTLVDSLVVTPPADGKVNDLSGGPT